MTVHTPIGDWSIFRRTDVFCEQTAGRKHESSWMINRPGPNGLQGMDFGSDEFDAASVDKNAHILIPFRRKEARC